MATVDMLLDMAFSISDRRPRTTRPWLFYDFRGCEISFFNLHSGGGFASPRENFSWQRC